jgi:hypothetical protein
MKQEALTPPDPPWMRWRGELARWPHVAVCGEPWCAVYHDGRTWQVPTTNEEIVIFAAWALDAEARAAQLQIRVNVLDGLNDRAAEILRDALKDAEEAEVRAERAETILALARQERDAAITYAELRDRDAEHAEKVAAAERAYRKAVEPWEREEARVALQDLGVEP